MSTGRSSRGFTLVELLVVIGIIALLISILLPSLSRARQAANVIKCQSNMRQMGQAIQLYAYTYDGYLPLANYSSDDDLRNWWPNTLGEMLGTERNRLNPIFSDVDAPEGDASWSVYSDDGGEHNHYTPNLRLINELGTWDAYMDAFGGGGPAAQRKVASVRNASEVAVIWDATSWANWDGSTWNGSAFFISDGADGWRWWWDHYYVFQTKPHPWFGDIDYSRPVETINADFVAGQTQGSPRFRHMNDTVCNLLFVDGHVESRKINPATGRSDFTARDLSTNFVGRD